MMVLFGGFVLVNKGKLSHLIYLVRANNNLNISIPCAAPSTPSKSLVGYKRARNSREKEVEDRTYPHLDHVDNPRQTTHAVGVLKAVKIGRHFSG